MYVHLMNTPQNNLLKFMQSRIKKQRGSMEAYNSFVDSLEARENLRFLHIFSPPMLLLLLLLSFEHKAAEGVLAWKWFFFIILLLFTLTSSELRVSE